MVQRRTSRPAFRPEAIGDFLEAVYSLDTDDQTWLGDAARAARDVWGRGGPLHAAIYDASEPAVFRRETMHTIDLPDSAVQSLAHAQLPVELVQRTVRTGLVHRSGRVASPAALDAGFDRMAQLGTPDCLTINGLDPEGKGVMIAFWTAGHGRLARDEEATYRRMAHHLGAANRCRRRLRLTGGSVTNGAEAILDDRLRIVHAEGEAREKEAQVELVAVANARSQSKTASQTALKMWPALIEARWTLVDSFERDGKRYVVARENQARVPGLGDLTARERQVVVYFALGQSTKETAYGLGIADSTVRVLLRRAGIKLGASSRRALQAHPDVCRVRTGGSA